MDVLELGAPETAPPPGQTHTHSGAGFRELKRLKSFEKNGVLLGPLNVF